MLVSRSRAMAAGVGMPVAVKVGVRDVVGKDVGRVVAVAVSVEVGESVGVSDGVSVNVEDGIGVSVGSAVKVGGSKVGGSRVKVAISGVGGSGVTVTSCADTLTMSDKSITPPIIYLRMWRMEKARIMGRPGDKDDCYQHSTFYAFIP